MVGQPGFFRGFLNIITGRRNHLNAVINPVFNELLEKLENSAQAMQFSKNSKIYRTMKYLLYCSFALIDSLFGETGEYKEYTKLVDSCKTERLMKLFSVCYFLSLCENPDYRKFLGSLPKRTDIARIFSSVYGGMHSEYTGMIKDWKNLDREARPFRLFTEAMAVVHGQKQPPKPDLEKKFIFASYFNTYATAFQKVLQIEN